LALVFSHYGITTLAALAFIAALFHCLNHALFKSLLFCVTGAVLHATGERNLGKLGGLIKFMPWVAGFGLVGALALAGLPPLNGFASEWLLLQAFLLTPGLPQSYLNMFIPVATGVIALTVALSAYVMVKFYGVVFLGQPREPKLRDAKRAAPIERAGLAWLALACIILGLVPTLAIAPLDTVAGAVLHAQIGVNAFEGGWLFLTPLAPERASYSAPIFFLVIAGVFLASFFFIRSVYHGRSRADTPWDCGFAPPTPRMQDTAEGFGQPIHQIFEPFFRIRRELPSPFDAEPRYRKVSEDRIWYALYLPIARAAEFGTSLVARLHHGRIALYLLYSFITLLFLLVFAR
jgi:NADH:ubiquinone oxidoreductase subunit 5 (subunit L)/multisubunit Na+/H+ antiporter MnhA subunit